MPELIASALSVEITITEAIIRRSLTLFAALPGKEEREGRPDTIETAIDCICPIGVALYETTGRRFSVGLGGHRLSIWRAEDVYRPGEIPFGTYNYGYTLPDEYLRDFTDMTPAAIAFLAAFDALWDEGDPRLIDQEKALALVADGPVTFRVSIPPVEPVTTLRDLQYLERSGFLTRRKSEQEGVPA